MADPDGFFVRDMRSNPDGLYSSASVPRGARVLAEVGERSTPSLPPEQHALARREPEYATVDESMQDTNNPIPSVFRQMYRQAYMISA